MRFLNFVRTILKILIISLIPFYGISQDDSPENGFVQYFYPNGQVASEGTLVDGKPDGYWITYYVTGIKKSEGKRKSHLLDSIWVFYNNKGDTLKKISYMFGKKNGYYLTYGYDNLELGTDTGVLISKELYINDKKEGKSFYHYDNGKLKREVTYVDGKKQGLSKEYSQEGLVLTLINYHNGYVTDREEINRYDDNGLKHGTWKEFYENGKVRKEEVYKYGKLDGLYKEFNEKGNMILALKYSDGKLEEEGIVSDTDIEIRNIYDDQDRIIESGAYRENIPIGIHRTYDTKGTVIGSKIYNDDGVVVSEGIVDEEGNRRGEWKDYYMDGKLKSAGTYVDNQRSGRWTFYFPNGNIEQTGAYIKGKTTGKWTWYYENGTLLREEEFFNGKEDGMIVEYSEDGKIITNGDFVEGEKEGEWYYKVGDHIELGSYITGLRDGRWKYFYADSTLKFEGTYIQGAADGKHTLFFNNGNVKEERYYVMGLKMKNWKKYDELGNLTMTITYKDDIETRVNGIRLDLPDPDIKIIK